MPSPTPAPEEPSSSGSRSPKGSDSSRGQGENAPSAGRASRETEDVPAEEPARPEANPPVSLRGEEAPPFYSESEMVERIREFEWSETPLGPVEDWPRELGIAVDIMLGADEAVSIYWGERHVLLYNDAWRKFIGDKHPEALGQPARETFPEIWETIGPRFAYVLEGNGAAFEREQRLPLRRDGDLEDAWFDYSFNPIPRADGSVGGVFNIGTEVTERVEAKEALRRSEEFHRLAAEAGNMGTWSVDLETGAAAISPRMATLMGYAPDEHEAVPSQSEPEHWQQMVPREAWTATIHPDDLPVIEQELAASQDTGEPFETVFRVRPEGAEGPVRWLYAKGEVTGQGPGTGRRLRGASIDITERRELEEAVVGASEKVRRDIGRKLHDVLSSDLAALAMRTDNLRHRLEAEYVGSEAFLDTLEEIIRGIRAAAEQSRSLSHALIPAALQEEHLAAALEHLCRERAELGTPAPTFEGDREEPLPASKETAMHLYYIAREAIANAQRHADADRIWVRLGREEGRLVLTVRDDGKGLSGEVGSGDGIGLRTMKHRADLIGTALRIESSGEGGTVVQCALPLSEADDE